MVWTGKLIITPSQTLYLSLSRAEEVKVSETKKGGEGGREKGRMSLHKPFTKRYAISGVESGEGSGQRVR